MLRTQMRAGLGSGLLLSALLAAFLTLVQTADALVPEWQPALGRTAAITLRLPGGQGLRAAAAGDEDAPLTHERVVIPQGTLLRASQPGVTEAVAYYAARRTFVGERAVGSFAIFWAIAAALTTYLQSFGQNRLRLLRVELGVVSLVAAAALVAKAMLLFTPLSAYWLPAAALPLWVASSYGRRSAFVVGIVLSLVLAALLRFDVALLAVLLAQTATATVASVGRKRGRTLLAAAALGGLVAALLCAALALGLEGTLGSAGRLWPISRSDLDACLGGGLVAGVLAMTLRGPAARALGSVSRERLLDLTDLEQPLLKKLAAEAPGTWEHCRAMANLAEQAASAIGADGLLTRVGAYYHDVGKTSQPTYFVENLGSAEVSPHDELDPDVSADAVMAHVVIGTRMLREAGIPEPVVDFAYTHHGTQLVEYFWNRCLQQGNPKGLTEASFRYPGLMPQTKEAAILMLADAIEAASRTIEPPNHDEFERMVQRVVFTKLKNGQLDDCGLDIAELRVVVERMTTALVSMHHHRVKYPWQAQRAEEFGVPSEAMNPRVELHGLASLHTTLPDESEQPQVTSRFPSAPGHEAPPPTQPSGTGEHAETERS